MKQSWRMPPKSVVRDARTASQQALPTAKPGEASESAKANAQDAPMRNSAVRPPNIKPKINELPLYERMELKFQQK